MVFAIICIIPNIAYVNSITLTESLTGSLLILLTYSLLKIWYLNNAGGLLIFILPILTLTKFEYAFLIPFVALILIYKRKHYIALLVGCSLFFGLTINGAKNKLIYGKFNPTSFGSGLVIYGGNNLNGDGSWHKVRHSSKYIDEESFSIYDSISNLSPETFCLERDILFKKMTLNALNANPIKVISTYPLKFQNLWLLPPNMYFHTGKTEFNSGLQLGELFDSKLYSTKGIIKHILYLATHWLSLSLILIGLTSRILKRPVHLLDVGAVFLILSISFIYAVPFYGLGRFVMPLYSILCMYLVFPLQWIADKTRPII